MSDFLMSEIRALAEAFKDATWSRGSDEPDARVTVLLYPGERTDSPYLCRINGGWVWAKDVEEIRQPVVDATNWRYAVEWVPRSEPLRLPVAEELLEGGWVTEDDRPGDTVPEPVDEAKARLDEGMDALDAAVVPHARTEQYLRAQTQFMASIAISLYELVALHKKYDFESVEVTDLDNEARKVLKDVAVEDMKPEVKEFKPGGPVGGDDFPWAR